MPGVFLPILGVINGGVEGFQRFLYLGVIGGGVACHRGLFREGILHGVLGGLPRGRFLLKLREGRFLHRGSGGAGFRGGRSRFVHCQDGTGQTADGQGERQQ